jgi:hypothetical protein
VVTTYFLEKNPCLFRRRRGEQGLDETVILHNRSFRGVMYDDNASMSIVVTTYFSKKEYIMQNTEYRMQESTQKPRL